MRPLILGGHGIRCAGLADRFRAAVERWRIPVTLTQLAKDLLPHEHPLFVGHVGVRGDRAGNWAAQNCSHLYVFGASLHEQTTGYDRAAFVPQAKRYDIGLNGFDMALLDHEGDPGWLIDCQAMKLGHQVRNEPHATAPLDGPVNIYEFVDVLSDLAPNHATILTDAGCAYYIMGQAFRCKEGQRYLAPGSLAEMGWCMPACTGAAFGDPTRLIIGVTGDGSFQTNVHELAVWRKHNLNIKLFVLDNGGYSCIRATQENYCGGRLIGIDDETGVGLPEVEDVADSYSLPAETIHRRDKLSEMAKFFDNFNGPEVIVIRCRSDQEFMPQVKSERLPDGTMRSGRLDEMWPKRDA